MVSTGPAILSSITDASDSNVSSSATSLPESPKISPGTFLESGHSTLSTERLAVSLHAMAYYNDPSASWSAPGRQPSWEQPQPPSRSGASH